MGARAPLRAEFTVKSCKCTPTQSKSQFLRTIFIAGRAYFKGGSGSFISFSLCLRATTKKRSSTYFREKVHSQRKSWLRRRHTVDCGAIV